MCVCVCVGGKKGGMEDEEVERWVWREGGRRLVCEREREEAAEVKRFDSF